MLDPATGRLTSQIAPELHFATLISDRSQSALYGVALGEKVSWDDPVQLVRLNALDGKVLKSRTLEPGVLLIAISPLLEIPAGDVKVKATL